MEQLLQKAAQALRDAARYGAGDWSELVDALERRASPASAPEGYAIVPVEPTMEMCEAGWNEYDLQEHFSVRFMYERMIATAPTPPVSEDRWLPIETAPKDGTEIWCYNGEHCVMRWISGDGYALWVYADQLLSDADPEPEQPTHWMPQPKAPAMQEDKP